MTHQISLSLSPSLKIFLYIQQNQVISLTTSTTCPVPRPLRIQNLRISDFHQLSQLPSSAISRFFQLSPGQDQLAYTGGLRGGGSVSSRSKRISNQTVAEANSSQIISSPGLYLSTSKEDFNVKFPGYSDDYDLTYLEEEALHNSTPLPKDNVERQLDMSNSDQLMGNYYLQIGKLQEAKKKFIDCYNTRCYFIRKGDESLTEILEIIARLSLETEKNPQESLEFYTKALKNCYENIEINQKHIFNVCIGLAKVYAKIGDIENFYEFYKFVEEDLRKMGIKEELEFCFEFGIKFKEFDYLTSNKFLLKAYSLVDKVAGFDKRKELFVGIADNYLDVKAWEDAKEFYGKALKIMENEDRTKPDEFLKVYKGLSKALESIGEKANLVKIKEKVLKYQEMVNDNDENLAKSLFELGLAQIKEAEIVKAIESFKKSIEIRLKLGKKPKDCIVAYKNIASAYYNQKWFKEARDYFEILQQIYKTSPELNDQTSLFNNLCNLGACYIETEDFPKAIQVYSELLTNEKWNQSRNEVESDFFSYAWALSKVERHKESGEMYEKSVFIEMKKNNPNFEFITKCYNNAESAFNKAQIYDKALSCAEANLKIMKIHFQKDRVKINLLKNNIEFYRRA